MRRAGAGVEREPNGTWTIAPDHLERAAADERMQARISPVVVQTLSALPLDRGAGQASGEQPGSSRVSALRAASALTPHTWPNCRSLGGRREGQFGIPRVAGAARDPDRSDGAAGVLRAIILSQVPLRIVQSVFSLTARRTMAPEKHKCQGSRR